MSGLSNKDSEDNEEIWKERCMNCIRCNVISNCGQCQACRNGKTCEARRCFSAKKLYQEKVDRKTEENLKVIMAKTAEREAQAASTSTSMAPPIDPPEKKKRGRKKGSTSAAAAAAAATTSTTTSKATKFSERDYVPTRPTRQHAADLRKRRTQWNVEPDRTPRQCLNPECILQARENSKYCSDECGKILAKMRLTEFLPLRVKDYFSSGQTGRRSYQDEIREKQELLQRDAGEFQKAEEHLTRFLTKLHEFVEKQVPLQPLGTTEKYDDNVYEACVVCGMPDIPLRKFTKHLELCWSRSEKAISFGAPEKNNENFYCEKYDQRTNTFCKRLKSLCPEHRKPGIEHCLKICGYPKKWEEETGDTAKTLSEVIESEDPFGEEGCRTKRDACHKHLKWIPSLRGSIELEQACLFQKMFELCHETHKHNTHSEWATNALSILMHKEPTIVDRGGFLAFVKSQSPNRSIPSTSSESQEKDEDLEDTAEFLASLAVQKDAQATTSRQEEGGGEDTTASTNLRLLTSTSSEQNQNVHISFNPNPTQPSPSLISPRSSDFSVSRLLE